MSTKLVDLKEITVEKLTELASEQSVYDAIEWAKNQYGEYPKWIERPSPPKNLNKITVEELKNFTQNLEKHEESYKEYKAEKESYNKRYNYINSIIEQFIKEEAGLFSIPEQYQYKVWRQAWEDGHSDGFHEVFNRLTTLLDIFN